MFSLTTRYLFPNRRFSLIHTLTSSSRKHECLGGSGAHLPLFLPSSPFTTLQYTHDVPQLACGGLQGVWCLFSDFILDTYGIMTRLPAGRCRYRAGVRGSWGEGRLGPYDNTRPEGTPLAGERSVYTATTSLRFISMFYFSHCFFSYYFHMTCCCN